MIRLKEFSTNRIVLTDGEQEHELTCKNSSQLFDLDTIEDILDYPERVERRDNSNE